MAVLLSLVQASPLFPHQAADNANQTSKKAKKNTEQVAEKATRTETPTNPAPPKTEESVKVRELPSVSVTKDWMDKAAWLFGAILLVVGIVGVCAAFRTLKAIERQVRVMNRQTEVIARQALSMRRQTTILRETAASTRLSADAAKASADAAIASERAWVMVDLDKVPGLGFLMFGTGLDAGGIHHDAGVRVRCICSNQGKTPAKILEKRAALILVAPDNPLPLTPNLDIEIEDPVPHYLQPGAEHKSDWTPSTQLSASNNASDIVTFFVVYGIVKYRHLFSEQIVHTTFGYRIRVDSVLERLVDYPKYNENT